MASFIHRLVRVGVLAATVALVSVPVGQGSVLIARNTKHVKLRITPKGQAILKFKQEGTARAVLAWGAINARAHPRCGTLQGPLCGPPQVRMKHRRLSRTGHFAKKLLKLPNKCRRYDGPELDFLVAACKAPNGTYWAAQSWVRLHKPCTKAALGVPELRLSHWRGPLADVTAYQSWKKRKGVYYDHIWGQVTYRGKPVYGLRWTKTGVPLDGYGRVIYWDTLNSGCGAGWRRMDGFLAKPWKGQFCYTTWLNHKNRQGDGYQATLMGPGVTPDVFVSSFPANHDFDLLWQLTAYQMLLSLSEGSKFCHPQLVR